MWERVEEREEQAAIPGSCCLDQSWISTGLEHGMGAEQDEMALSACPSCPPMLIHVQKNMEIFQEGWTHPATALEITLSKF